MSLEKYLANIRSEFPQLQVQANGRNLVYLDSAATALKPCIVIKRLQNFYQAEVSNVHRGAHFLSDQATRHFEEARTTVARFLNAQTSEEVIFTKGTTEGINLVASSYGESFLSEGDEVLLSEMEHHANIVPWQILAQKKKLQIRFVRVTDAGELDESSFKSLLTSKTKIVALTACSNTLGTINQLRSYIDQAHQVGAVVLVDGAQIVSQQVVDVQALDCDFFVFSAHKLFGPFGTGVLYGKKSILDRMPPYQGGGSMIHQVTTSGVSFHDVPFRFEAGTPNVEGVLGMAEAIKFFTSLDLNLIHRHEAEMMNYATTELKKFSEVKIIGEAKEKAAIISFNLQGTHHSDVGQILDQQGIAVRAGHHCTQPLMARMGITGTVRASFSIYNQISEVDLLISAVKKAKDMLL